MFVPGPGSLPRRMAARDASGVRRRYHRQLVDGSTSRLIREGALGKLLSVPFLAALAVLLPFVPAVRAQSEEAQDSVLSVQVILRGAFLGPVDDAHFGPPADASSPVHPFEGTLSIPEQSLPGMTALRDPYERLAVREVRRFPKLDLRLVMDGGALIPLEEGLRFTGHARWNAIVGAGRIWQVEEGLSQASLPFALVERNQNCTHNGVLSFLWNGSQVSPVAFQITQETCLYFKFDAAGALEARYRAGAVAEREAVVSRYRRERSGRLPVRELRELERRPNGERVDHSAFQVDLDVADTLSSGVVLDRTLYTEPIRTRHGTYPYPDELRLPSYSTAKTAFAAAALLRLAEVYGSEVLGTPLGAYLDIPGRRRLEDVTFENALDMATGHYVDPGEQVDEKSAVSEADFFLEENLRKRLIHAASYPHREEAGKRWVYRSSDTFLLIAAMDRFLEKREGPGADIFEWVIREVFEPIGLSAGARRSVRTGNRDDGLPFGGYGLFWTRDDLAKLAIFWGSDRGRAGGRQVLQPELLASAMQRRLDDPGLAALHRGDAARYRLGMWARQVSLPNPAGVENAHWVPLMLGYGGIGVALVPNGSAYFYVGDGDRHAWIRAARELSRLGE